MTCRAIGNAISDKLVYSDVLTESGVIYSTKESENKDAECNFCNGKFSEDEQRENWIKWFSWTLSEQRMQNMPMTFIIRLEAETVFA